MKDDRTSRKEHYMAILTLCSTKKGVAEGKSKGKISDIKISTHGFVLVFRGS